MVMTATEMTFRPHMLQLLAAHFQDKYKSIKSTCRGVQTMMTGLPLSSVSPALPSSIQTILVIARPAVCIRIAFQNGASLQFKSALPTMAGGCMCCT